MMYTEKDLELARDIAREQYTDGVPASNAQWGEGDPDDPNWREDEDDEPTPEDMRQFLLDRGYPLRALAPLDDTTLKQWYKDELEEMNQHEEDNRCDYERHPLDSSYYEDARFM